MRFITLAGEIIDGRRLTAADPELSELITGDLEEMAEGADRIRQSLCGDRVDLCSIVNGRGGKCSENCKFCAQSAHHRARCLEYGFLDKDEFVRDCGRMAAKGVDRYSIVTAGRTLQRRDPWYGRDLAGPYRHGAAAGRDGDRLHPALLIHLSHIEELFSERNAMKTAHAKTTSIVSTKSMVLIAMMAAATCILAPFSISIPISPVPISLTNLVIYFAAYIIGFRRGVISYCIYLLIGLLGLPVFSGFTGGAGKLLGPTGGYLIGFIFMAVCCGISIEHWNSRVAHFAGMAVGTLVCYLFGTVWLAAQTGMGFNAALAAGVLPFIPGDLVKMIAAVVLGPDLRSRLQRFDTD